MADPVKRLHYFDHQFLRAKDFTDEQDYHIRMRRLHNQLLHVWGVAKGLDLTAPAGSTRVTVREGAAIDGQGRELVLPAETQTVDLSGFVSKSVFVTIRYDEQESDPTTETGAAGTTRSTERPIIEVSLTPPSDNSLQLILGQAVVGADGKIASTNPGTDPNRRRPAGVVGGDLSVSSLTVGDPSISTDRWARIRLGAPNRLDLDSALRLVGGLGVGTDPSTLAADFGGPGRIRVRQGAAGTAGVWFNEGAKGDRALVGMADDNNVGLFGNPVGWGLVMNADTGHVGIGTASPSASLDVAGVLHVAGSQNPTTTLQGTYLSWNVLTGGTGETDFINNQGLGTGGFAFMNTPPAGSPRANLMVITGGGNVGIGTTTPAFNLDVLGNGTASPAVRIMGSGANGGSGEPSLLLATTNTGGPTTWSFRAGSSNSIQNLRIGTTSAIDLVNITPTGNVGIGTAAPSTTLHIGNASSYTRDARITMATASGAGQTRTWSIGVKYGATVVSSPNYGLTIRDESAGVERMVIDWATGFVGINATNLNRTLHVEGSEVHSGGTGAGFSFSDRDGVGAFVENGAGNKRWVWYSFGGFARLWTAGRDVFNINGTTGVPSFLGGKGGYVMDQFVNTLEDTLEEGDVVVIGANQTSLYYGIDNGIPIPEVDLTAKAMDTRVCGIVSSVHGSAEATEEGGPATTSKHFTTEELTAVDPKKVTAGQIGWMVTLGAYAHCKVDADIAPIEVGDLLATSPTKGYAQKALSGAKGVGAILGKALGSLASGKGKIPILVTLH